MTTNLKFDQIECPNCGLVAVADFVDIGVGMQQSGPFGCEACGWIEGEQGPRLMNRFREVKLKEVSAGQTLIADGGFTCIKEGAELEVHHSSQDGKSLFVPCDKGEHYLDGQEDEHGFLIGFKLKGERSNG